jgi:hypothetical protein
MSSSSWPPNATRSGRSPFTADISGVRSWPAGTMLNFTTLMPACFAAASNASAVAFEKVSFEPKTTAVLGAGDSAASVWMAAAPV